MSELNTKRIVISLPQKLLSEVDRVIKKENLDRSEFIHQATEMFLRERRNSRQFRDEMRQGYMEMAKINLTIASEAFMLEEEADHTLDRLVSGV